MDLAWDTLTPETFKKLEKGDFEDFCRELLDLEWSDRHDRGSEVVGPEEPDKPDGGRDLTFTVKAPPQEAADEYKKRYGVRPLTPDEGCRAYSCKTGKTWREKALEEAAKRSASVLPVLREGGTFTLLVNRPVTARDEPPAAGPRKKKKPPEASAPGKKARSKAASGRKAALHEGAGQETEPGESAAEKAPDKQSLIKELARAYAARLAPEGPTETELGGRIHIIDANDLYQFLRGRRPVLSARFASLLGVRPIPGLLTLEDWRRSHTQDRRPAPAFVQDGEREALRREIVAVLTSRAHDPYDRALWVVGPPGIGKTRLVLETLEEDRALKRRVLVAPTHVEGLAAIREHEAFDRYGALVLVIDDCPPHEVMSIAPFLSKLSRDPAAAFIVLTPGTTDALPYKALHQRLTVAPLRQETTEAIVQREAGPSVEPARVAHLAALAEGFPWFAALVAREIAGGASLPVTVAEAADLALASPREEQGRFDEEVIARARALFAVMLTEDVDWAELNIEEREALYQAVDAPSWAELDRARRACERRGLLRVRAGGKFKYVTPEILSREVARKLLVPPPGGGPSPIGPRLRRVPQWARALYERLERLGLSMEELQRLATEVVSHVRDAGPGLVAFGREGVPGAALQLAARYAPLPLGGLLRARIEQVSLEALRARRDVRRDVVWALERIARREGGFEDAEATLFRLAQAENEAYGNNATGVWKTLFFVGMNPTRSPWEERYERLRGRCRSGPSQARTLGLAGIDAALSQHLSLDRPPGEAPPQSMTRKEAREARADAWELLLACALDEDAEVACQARKLIGRHLRGAVRDAILDRFADHLIELLPRFDEASLREVRSALEHTETYEKELLAREPTLREAFARLAQAAVPCSFRERLHQQVGAWGAVAALDDEQRQDEQLAREGLTPPERPLLSEVEWLLSPAAVRKMPFAIALGRADAERVLLSPLVERTRAGASPDVLSAYCVGMSDAGRAAEVDDLLAQWKGDPKLAGAAVLTIVRAGGDDRRAGYLMDALHNGQLAEGVIGALMWGSWSKGLGDGALRAVIESLLERPSAAAASAALDLILERLKADPQQPDLRAPLLRCMERLAGEVLVGMAAYTWALGGKQLLDMGQVADACRLAIQGVLTPEAPASDHHWLVVKACEERAPDALWEVVRGVLEEKGKRAYRLATDLRWHDIGARFPVDRVLAWVGRDHQRATLVSIFAQAQGDELPALARGLVARFGPDSTPARALASAVQSTFGLVPSLAEFHRQKLDHVRRWMQDADPNVRAWATALSAEVERSEEFHTAHEEHERRRVGT